MFRMFSAMFDLFPVPFRHVLTLLHVNEWYWYVWVLHVLMWKVYDPDICYVSHNGWFILVIVYAIKVYIDIKTNIWNAKRFKIWYKSSYAVFEKCITCIRKVNLLTNLLEYLYTIYYYCIPWLLLMLFVYVFRTLS